MFGLQETTETCATTTAQGTHEEEEERATGLHVQVSGNTHTDMRTRTFPEVGYSQVLRCRRHEKRMRAGCMTSTVRIMVALSVRDRLPIQPQLAEPPPAPGIHLVLRDLTPDMYSGVNRIGPREKRVTDRECDQGYMQFRAEDQTSTDDTVCTYGCGQKLHCSILACEHVLYAHT